MSSVNIGWLFYKDYFSGIDYDDLKSLQNGEVLKSKVDKIIKETPVIVESESLGNIQFKATTTYPGLLLGSGTTHELPKMEGQAILGFHFDYTTGLPIIPSSSVKGVLRSAFKYSEYIQELLKDENITLKLEDIKNLELEIFGQDNGVSKVLQGKDIFFDATLVSAGVGGKILDDDYITPHKNRDKKTDEDENLLPDEIFNPVPLRFIKVLPNVTFRFDFELQDYNDVITKENKATIFTKILVDLGVGAKTNVGYGKLDIKTTFIKDEPPLEKIFIEFDNNTANIVNAYNQGLKDKVKEFKDEFVEELLSILNEELEQERKKQKKEKIKNRIEKVKNF